VLLDLLGDERVQRGVADAERAYAERRTNLISALQERGIEIPTIGSGLNLWVPVRDERDAVVALAAQGIGVAPGSPFKVHDPDHHHVRVTISALPADVSELADALARANQPFGRRTTGV